MKINLLPGSWHFYRFSLPSRLFLMMKLITFLLVATLTQVAATGFGQKISLNEKNVTVESALQSIEKQTDFLFLYDKLDLPQAQRVSINIKSSSIEETLNRLFDGLPLSYRIFKKNIVIKKEVRVREEAAAPAVVEPRIDRTLKGKVVDETGTGLPGVSIVLKGTQMGTTTNNDGEFQLTFPGENGSNAVLVFSFVGYKTQEKDVNNQTSFSISLLPEPKGLNEVVVTAIGLERSKKSLGYSVQQVSSEELTNSRETSIVSALSSKAAGVQVTSSSGAAGGGAQIRIRGSASLTGNNSPLFVIDGVPIDNSQNRTLTGGDGNAGVVHSNRVVDINPDDVASMTILKGPAATALYGIRAASGAIIITTKRGERSAGRKHKISYSSSFVINEVNRLPKEQHKYAQGAETNGVPKYTDPTTGVITSFGPEIASLTYSSQPNKFTTSLVVPASDPRSNGVPLQAYDNTGNFFRKGSTFDNHLSFSGGSENSNFYFALGRLSQKGIVPTEQFDRTTFKMSGDVSLTSKLNLSGSATYSKSGGVRVQQGSNSSGGIMGLFRSPVSFDIANGYGDPVNEPLAYSFLDGTQRNSGGNNAGYDNPFWSVKKNHYVDDVDRLIGFMQSDYEIFSWMKLMGRVGIDVYNDSREESFSKYSRGQVAGRTSSESYLQRSINSDLILTINHNFSSDLNFTALVGHNYFSYYNKRTSVTGTGLSIPDFFNISGSSTITGGTGLSRRKLNAAYADLRLSYLNYLFLNFTGRNEWSSTLPKNNSSFFYPAISLGFAFTELINVNKDIFSFGKLRASYAQVGNDSPIYSLYNTFSPTSAAGTLSSGGGIVFPYQNQIGLSVGNASGNPMLRPEVRVSTEFGGEFKFFKNRLDLDLTYYNSVSKDLIVSVPLPNSSGYTSTIRNVGEISNRGFEVVLNGDVVKRDKFQWDVSVNWSRNVSKILKISDGIESIGVTSVGPLGQIRLVSGQPFAVIYGNDFIRDTQGRVLIDDAPFLANGVTKNANYGFPSRDPNPKAIGNTNPKWNAGFRNTFTYGKLSLTALFDIRYKFDIYNGTRGSMNQSGTSLESEDRYVPTVFDGVKKGDGAKNDIQVVKGQYWYTGVGGGFGSGVNTQFVEDGSWLRMRELNLSYRFSSELLKKIRVSSANFTLTGRNLLLFTNYSGVDPETNLNGDNNASGYDYFSMPNTRSYGVALSLTF